ncbi:hypothetical protein MTR67_032015, partial [Solanum verrucosum]
QGTWSLTDKWTHTFQQLVSERWILYVINTKRIDPEGMTASPSLEEGKSTTCLPRFNGKYYWWWKTKIHDYIMAKDNELWDLVLDGPYIPTKNVKERDLTQEVPKCRRDYDK